MIRGCLPASGKTGLGVEKILEAIVERVPAPKGDTNAPFKPWCFDSGIQFLSGHHCLLPGAQRRNQKRANACVSSTLEQEYNADEIGVLGMDLQPEKTVKAGNVGYIISGIKNAKEVKVGDTLTLATNPCEEGGQRF